ncbi:NAD-glutamate dehydrogenase [Thioalkalivibrio sp. HK1]|uniref:NAD-glutamate dehydrogenase n=1 Tax=Thioalkalivibrio sp. HK1 TaxID=1469245 RepID=UPI00047011D8|nr:NAD-glutamate dehydrogenase [Thioalkalivibrio sp. HK1]
MNVHFDSRRDELLAALKEMACERAPGEEAALVRHFVDRYYADISLDDLRDRELADLYGAAASHFDFCYRRQSQEIHLRVYNPQLERHGWQSTHSVVEIITDDRPFLVDSVRMVLNDHGLTCHFMVNHVMRFRRQEQGYIEAILDGSESLRMPEGDDLSPPDASAPPAAVMESMLLIEVDRQTEEEALITLADSIRCALHDVRIAVDDRDAMQSRLREAASEISMPRSPGSQGESSSISDGTDVREERAFLEWLDDGNFVFLGYVNCRIEGLEDGCLPQPGSGLGLLRDDYPRSGDIWSGLPPLPLPALSQAADPLSESVDEDDPRPAADARTFSRIALTRASARSTVHRPGYLDYVGIRQFDAAGELCGEHRFVGLYASSAYLRTPEDIPLLRYKVRQTLSLAGFPVTGYAMRALRHIIHTLPRPLLFHLPVAALLDTAIGILRLQERRRIRLFVHPDPFGEFISCLVYVPRERYNTAVRTAIQSILEDALGAVDTQFGIQLSESVLAQVHFLIRVDPAHPPHYEVVELERRLRKVSRTWSDDLYDALLDRFGEERAAHLFRRYGEAFRSGYREIYSARIAVLDIEKMERIRQGDDIEMSLYRPLHAREGRLRFKLFILGKPVSLSDILPMLENMGLEVEEEQPSRIDRAGTSAIWLHDIGMWHTEGLDIDPDRIGDRFREAFAQVWSGEVDNDGFNRLVLGAGLSWREVVVLRAGCKYLRQAGVGFSQDYMEDTLAANPHIASMLIELFRARFDPAAGGEALPRSDEAYASGASAMTGADSRDERVLEVESRIEAALDDVTHLDQDRILRSYLGIVRAMLRTNYFQRNEKGSPKSYLSIKLDPHRIESLPEPRPKYEIFVYSPEVEGVHLRGGAVARGGIRWSNRREDFRTEVLGLVKAQIAKNAVIVPVGSKGGFVCKRLPPNDREAISAAGIAGYRTFIRGMLDLTDNLSGGEVIPPSDVVRYDPDDPYLVVAADKGTATFSDIANALAHEYGFWLGDAFASGGSQGYDHKGMGITARGAWESVKRHFRDLGIDVQNGDFTVVGIGDMGGDVFGNGMLLSPHIRLQAAFNHQHIFLDPDPDPKSAFEERKRLFSLSPSTWDDYDRASISKGGGIWPRSAKSIPISFEVRKMLAIESDIESPSMTPNELIRAILRSPVDLLWNGGIGTYVKSTLESDAEVGDRINDAVRINGDQLRCQVVAEGGNLGLTQRGRIEYAAAGGRINTDAIDNSGGVDCSDREVNIKILLNDVVSSGDMTSKQRNRLLEEMGDEVASDVLRNNYLQTQALGTARSLAASLLEVHSRLIRRLERDGVLMPAIEYLPEREEIEERRAAGKGLLTPELSVLMAYVKIHLFERLLASGLSTEPFASSELQGYFPSPLRDRHADRMSAHPLAQEIVSTVVANEMVNRCGITFAYRLGEETGADEADIARAYLVARDVYEMDRIWRSIESLDHRVPAAAQIMMLQETRKLAERAARWLLRNRPRPLDVERDGIRFADGVKALRGLLRDLLTAENRRVIDENALGLMQQGVPEEIALEVAGCNDLLFALDVVEIAHSADTPFEESATVYFTIGEALDFYWIRAQIGLLSRENRWEALARAALRDDLHVQLSALALDALRMNAGDSTPAERVEIWLSQNHIPLARCREILSDLRSMERTDFTMISVAMGEIRTLRQSL